MKVLKLTRQLVLGITLIVSLVFNVALLALDGFYAAVAGAFSVATGIRSVVLQQADELADTRAELVVERQVKRELGSELAETSSNLASERLTNQQLRREAASVSAELARVQAVEREIRSQLTDASAQLATAHAMRRDAMTATLNTTGRIGARIQKSAARELAAMPAEAIPYYGTAVIVAATTVELADMCATMIDLTELQKLFEPDIDVAEPELTVCGLQVPSREEIIAGLKEAPEKAWKGAIEAIPSSEELKNLDVDWTQMSNSVTQRAGEVAQRAQDAVSDKLRQFRDWSTAGD